MVKDNTMDKQKKKIILSNFYTQQILDGIGKGDLDSIKQLALHKPDMLPTDIRRVVEKFHSLDAPVSKEPNKPLKKEDGGGERVPRVAQTTVLKLHGTRRSLKKVLEWKD